MNAMAKNTQRLIFSIAAFIRAGRKTGWTSPKSTAEGVQMFCKCPGTVQDLKRLMGNFCMSPREEGAVWALRGADAMHQFVQQNRAAPERGVAEF